jgi:hypothetical protein
MFGANLQAGKKGVIRIRLTNGTTDAQKIRE